jgi:hypothetical protein
LALAGLFPEKKWDLAAEADDAGSHCKRLLTEVNLLILVDSHSLRNVETVDHVDDPDVLVCEVVN